LVAAKNADGRVEGEEQLRVAAQQVVGERPGLDALLVAELRHRDQRQVG
jgi:uncharacterized membrane protein YebE (DUF533 family)